MEKNFSVLSHAVETEQTGQGWPPVREATGMGPGCPGQGSFGFGI